jgi:hypothetical protein
MTDTTMTVSNKIHQLKSLDTLTSSPCSVFQRLLAHLPSTRTPPEQPSFSEVRVCGESGCVTCQLIWDGVSRFFPEVASWNDTTAFILPLRENNSQWLRVGIARIANDVALGVPREWVDFRWLTANGKSFPWFLSAVFEHANIRIIFTA